MLIISFVQQAKLLQNQLIYRPKTSTTAGTSPPFVRASVLSVRVSFPLAEKTSSENRAGDILHRKWPISLTSADDAPTLHLQWCIALASATHRGCGRQNTG